MSGSIERLESPGPLPSLDEHRERLRMRTVAAISVLGSFGVFVPPIRVVRDKPKNRCEFCGSKKFPGCCPACNREESPECLKS